MRLGLGVGATRAGSLSQLVRRAAPKRMSHSLNSLKGSHIGFRV